MPAIASSAAAVETGPATLTRAAEGRAGRVALGVTLLALGAAMLATHRTGHYWGDDFALYVRQADALFGPPDIGRVIDDNRFMLDHSRNPDFSPPVYPWGWPLVLSVPVAVVGRDVDALAVVTTVAMLAFLVAWYRFARDRLARPLALLGMVLLGLSPMYVGWTDLLGSEPLFMAAVFATFVSLDRCAERWTATWTSPAVAGLGAAACFSIRREGIALLVAIAVAQSAALGAHGIARLRRDRRLAGFLAAPYAAFAAAVGIVQALLPSTLIPEYEGTSVGNILRFRDAYVGAVAWTFGSDALWVGWLVVASAVAGLAFRVVTARRDDAPIVAYAVVVALIGCSFHIPSDRYVATVIPILLYGLLQLPAALLAALGRGWRWPVALGATAILALALWSAGSSVADAARAASRAEGTPVDGPQAPAAVEMFAAVERFTAPDDVIGFLKARAMTLETGRRAVQVGGDRSPLAEPIAYDVVVLRSHDPTAAELQLDTARFEVLWRNIEFVMFATRQGSGPT